MRPGEWYRPPAVGKLEQTSAIASPTNSVMMPTIGQPQTLIAGPPVIMPYPSGCRTKSPKPPSQDGIAYPPTVRMSTSTASR